MIGHDDVGLFPIRGKVDGEGRLIDADPPLAALHGQSGGVIGTKLAIPQLINLVRLVNTSRVNISRPVTVGDNGTDIELFVSARPDGDGVLLEIDDWMARPVRPTLASPEATPKQDFARASADFTWQTDADMLLTDLSPHAAAALGTTVEALIGQSITRLFGLFETATGRLPLFEAAADEADFEGQTARLRGSDYGLLSLSGAVLIDEEGRFAGYHGMAIEIEDQGPVSAAAADRLHDAGITFGADIGKALKDPLDRIVACADVIRTQADGPLRRGYADYASDIAAAGRHLLSLVEDIMEVQAIERSDYRPEREPLDLCDIARRAAGLLGVRAADRSVRIDAPDDRERLPAIGEFRRVLQILVNLIGNAVRHSPAGGMVWLRAEQENGMALMIVADQGAGIAAEDHDRIFDKFERLAPTEGPGSGLGLYISRRLARAMGGDVTVDSAPGQGARFILTLPSSLGGGPVG